MPKPKIVVVFDLDETLGSFAQLSVLKDVVEYCEDHKLTQNEFNVLLDRNPEFLRPGIIEILKYIVKQREAGKCDGIMIYTNNQGPKEWAEAISRYFTYKVGSKVFDQIIAAFKVNGRKVEMGRTSHDKSFDDFIHCTKLPRNTQVCFIDDVEHPQMEHRNVYYINVKPYDNRVPISIGLKQYYGNTEKQTECIRKAHNIFRPEVLRGEQKTQEEYEVDIVIGKYINQHIHEFFKLHSKNHNKGTRRRHNKHTKGTAKRRVSDADIDENV